MPAQSAFANGEVGPLYDGSPYCIAAVVPAAEDNLNLAASPAIPGGSAIVDGPSPAHGPQHIPVMYGQSILAVVELSTRGTISSQTTTIFLQTDLGDGVWIDVAWLTFTGTASQNFCLSSDFAGANSFALRTSGTAPNPANGSNKIPLGGRVRFTGKTTITASSSSSSAVPGVTPAVLATIRYKMTGLR